MGSQKEPSLLTPRTLLQKSCDKFGYSARVIHKLLRMARTSADLAESKNIRPEDVTYALHLRDLDRSTGLWDYGDKSIQKMRERA